MSGRGREAGETGRQAQSVASGQSRSRAKVIEIVIVTYCAYWLTSSVWERERGR